MVGVGKEHSGQPDGRNLPRRFRGNPNRANCPLRHRGNPDLTTVDVVNPSHPTSPHSPTLYPSVPGQKWYPRKATDHLFQEGSCGSPNCCGRCKSSATASALSNSCGGCKSGTTTKALSPSAPFGIHPALACMPSESLVHSHIPFVCIFPSFSNMCPAGSTFTKNFLLLLHRWSVLQGYTTYTSIPVLPPRTTPEPVHIPPRFPQPVMEFNFQSPSSHLSMFRAKCHFGIPAWYCLTDVDQPTGYSTYFATPHTLVVPPLAPDIPCHGPVVSSGYATATANRYLTANSASNVVCI